MFLIAEMSTNDAINDIKIIEESLKIARQHDDFVCGFICQHNIGSIKVLLSYFFMNRL